MDILARRNFWINPILIFLFRNEVLSVLLCWISRRGLDLGLIFAIFFSSEAERIILIWIWACSTFRLVLQHISHIGLALTHYHVFIFFWIFESIICISTLTKQMWIEKICKYWVLDHIVLLLKVRLLLLQEAALISPTKLTNWIDLAHRIHLLDNVSNHPLIVLALLERGLSVDAVEVVFKI